MYTLQTNACFDSAHFLKGYEGKCSNIHGHRWKVEVTILSDELSNDEQTKGMIVDFKTLKDDLTALCDYMDHCLIIESGSLKDNTLKVLHEEGFRIVEMDFRPTAENMAKYFFEEMANKGYRVVLTKVYETPNNCAGYSG